MFESRTILIVESCAYGALDLSSAVEERDGRVAGPVATVSEALNLLDSEDIGAAVVDCELSDAMAVVMRLADRSVPFVIQTSTAPPQSVEFLDVHGAVLVKPVDPATVLDTLLAEIDKVNLVQSEWVRENP